jgi:hypothetical protein
MRVKDYNMLILAAIKRNNRIITDKRHYLCIRKAIKLYNWKKPILAREQGFVDEKGNYYNRKEAKQHAINCRQISPNYQKILISEDLW